jgi:hypothetical protein
LSHPIIYARAYESTAENEQQDTNIAITGFLTEAVRIIIRIFIFLSFGIFITFSVLVFAQRRLSGSFGSRMHLAR